MRRFANWIVFGCLTAIVVSCSSDGRAAGLDLGTAVATSATRPTATDPPAPTTQPVTPTAPATTTTPPVAAPPAVTDPPTATTLAIDTTPSVESKEDKVKADFESARLARHQCAYTPEACDFASIAITASPMDMRTRDQIAMRLQYNLRAVAGKGDEFVRVESVGFEGESAFVTICVYDTVQIYDVGAAGDPADDILYNGQVTSSRVRWEMRLEGERWLLFAGTDLDRLDEGDLCGI